VLVALIVGIVGIRDDDARSAAARARRGYRSPMAKVIARISVSAPAEYAGEYEVVSVEPPPPPPPDPWVTIPGSPRIYCPKGKTGPSGPAAVVVTPIAAAKRYRLRYEVMPEGAFDFRAGGKLPGLGGGSVPAGGSTDVDGFSGRLMWGAGGRLSFYFYRVTGGVGGIDTGGYGTHWMWAADAKLQPGQWNAIELLCDVATGETVGYLNGVEKGRQTLKYLWPTVDRHVFSVFFGGQGDQYAPLKDEYLSFRNMKVLPG